MVTETKGEKKRADYEKQTLTEMLHDDPKRKVVKIQDKKNENIKYALTGSSINEYSLTDILGGPI
jgi:hypothetical protein